MNTAVARRYAKALIMIAAEKNSIDLYQKELEAFIADLQGNQEVQEMMNNPRIQPNEKKEVLAGLVKDKYSMIVSNFLNLIIDKRRESCYADIVKEFNSYADEARNIVEAEVRTVVQLSDKDYKDLQKRLSMATSKEVRLKPVIDTTMIGGMIVKIGETVIDGSLTKRLTLLKKHLKQSQFEGIGVIK